MPTADFDSDNCFLERQNNTRGSPLFFSLAVIFGVVGTVSSSYSGSWDETNAQVSNTVVFNSGQIPKAAEERLTDETLSAPIKDGLEYDEPMIATLEKTSPSQKVFTAISLLL